MGKLKLRVLFIIILSSTVLSLNILDQRVAIILMFLEIKLKTKKILEFLVVELNIDMIWRIEKCVVIGAIALIISSTTNDNAIW